MSDDDFEYIVERSLEQLPPEFREKLRNVSIVTADWPSREQLASVDSPKGLLLGLYQGMPNVKGAYYRMKLPDKITLFKTPLLMVSRSKESFVNRVYSTLLHEIAHHFGMDEAQVHEAERNRLSSTN